MASNGCRAYRPNNALNHEALLLGEAELGLSVFC